MYKKIALAGAGDLGQQMATVLKSTGYAQEVCFFDDTLPVETLTQHGKVHGRLQDMQEMYSSGAFSCFFLAVGYKHFHARKIIFEQLAHHIPQGVFIHPSAIVDNTAKVGSGSFISAGCVLDLNVSVGQNVFLYPGSIIAHDTIIGAHSFLAPGVTLAGHVYVNEQCFLGVGTTVSDSVQVCKGTCTGAGTVLIADTVKSGWYVGNPARWLKPS